MLPTLNLSNPWRQFVTQYYLRNQKLNQAGLKKKRIANTIDKLSNCSYGESTPKKNKTNQRKLKEARKKLKREVKAAKNRRIVLHCNNIKNFGTKKAWESIKNSPSKFRLLSRKKWKNPTVKCAKQPKKMQTFSSIILNRSSTKEEVTIPVPLTNFLRRLWPPSYQRGDSKRYNLKIMTRRVRCYVATTKNIHY